MTIRKSIGLTVGLAVAALAIATPASAAWWGNGQWYPDNRWNNNDRYYGYYYREPPVVYSTPYNYGYVPPPVIYNPAGPGFSITIRP